MTVNFQMPDKREQASLGRDSFHQWVGLDCEVEAFFYRLDTRYLLRFPRKADFEVSSDGLNVLGWPVPGVPFRKVERLYRSQVHRLVLARQGKVVLHASAVDVNGHGLVFVGESGCGKSTLSASFATAGFRFLTDDGLPLEEAGCQWQILPDYPSIRLWQDSHDAFINGETTALPTATTKRLLASPHIAHCDEPRPLHCVYFLGEGKTSSLTIERLKPAAALLELTRSAIVLDMTEKSARARHFDRMTRLASLPIHYHLDYPRRYDYLPRVREALIRHDREREVKQYGYEAV